jgi:hypothetical protein
MFVELPSGELLNTAYIIKTIPLTSGATRVYFVDAAFSDYPEEHVEIIRKAIKSHKPEVKSKK